MNTCSRKYTPQELEQLHKALYEILGEIVRICEKHQIPFFVIGEQPLVRCMTKPSFHGMTT